MITLTFKSGSLWHGEYQVVNPEVIPGVDVMLNDGVIVRADETGNDIEPLQDGDHITLPEGYGIDKTRTCKWHGILNNCGNETCWDLEECQFSPEKFVATITLPEKPKKYEPFPQISELSEFESEKPDNSAHGYTLEPCRGVNCPFEYSCKDGCLYPRKKKISDQAGDNIIVNPVVDNSAHSFTKGSEVIGNLNLGMDSMVIGSKNVEPSESQEEIWKDAIRFMDERQETGLTDLANEIKEKFTITRK